MRTSPRHPESGLTLLETIFALGFLAVGILAMARLFPAGERGHVQDRLVSGADGYAQEQVELLTGLAFSDTALTAGRHPGGTATISLGSGQWQRYYTVTDLTGTLSNLKRVDVVVNYAGAGRRTRSVTASTFVRR